MESKGNSSTIFNLSFNYKIKLSKISLFKTSKTLSKGISKGKGRMHRNRVEKSLKCATATGARPANVQVHCHRHNCAWPLLSQQDCAAQLHSCASFLISSFGSQGFIGPLMFLQVIPKALLSIKTRGFLLKVRHNTL